MLVVNVLQLCFFLYTFFQIYKYVTDEVVKLCHLGVVNSIDFILRTSKNKLKKWSELARP